MSNAKWKEVDQDEAAVKLGLAPEPGAANDQGGSLPADQVEGQTQPVQQLAQQAITDVSQSSPQPQVDQQLSQEPKLSDAERAKLWQSNHDKIKVELEREQKEKELYQQQIDFYRHQATQQQPQLPVAPVQQANELKEPVVSDFINGDDGYDITVSDPRYQQYLQARDIYNREIIKQETLSAVTQQQQETQRQTLMQKRAARVAERYPEYVNKFTGEVDYVRLQNDLSFIDDDPDAWVKLLDVKNGVTANNAQLPQNPAVNLAQQISNRADSVSSVATATPAPGTIEISDEDKEMSGLFGNWRTFE